MSTPLFTLKNVSLTIPGVEHEILSNISYQIFPGDFIVLLGSNGSGKSSLLKLLDRRLVCTSGDISFHEKPLANYTHKALAPNIKTLTQNCNESLFSTLTIFENYLLVKQQHESQLFSLKEKGERAFLANYLKEYNAKLSIKLDQTVDKLSGGEKQALALALTMLYPPYCLLLDEHTSALDPKAAEQLMKLTATVIKKHQITCILTTHDLAIAEQYGNRIMALRHGKIHHRVESEDKCSMNQQNLLADCY